MPTISRSQLDEVRRLLGELPPPRSIRGRKAQQCLFRLLSFVQSGGESGVQSSHQRPCVACGSRTGRMVFLPHDDDAEKVTFNGGKARLLQSGQTNYSWWPRGRGEAALAPAKGMEDRTNYVVPLHLRCEREHFRSLLTKAK